MNGGLQTSPKAGGSSVPALERLLTPKEIAEAWQLDESTIRRIFQDLEGVLKIATNNRKKRPYVTLRIPLAVYQRVVKERSR